MTDEDNMEKLIKALQIFLKYANPANPTHCEHDELWIMDVDIHDMAPEDIAEVEELGFHWSENDDSWKSYHFGSA